MMLEAQNKNDFELNKFQNFSEEVFPNPLQLWKPKQEDIKFLIMTFVKVVYFCGF